MLLVEIALVEAVEAVEREAVEKAGEDEDEARAGDVVKAGDALIVPPLRTETPLMALSPRSVERAGTVIAGEVEEAGVALMAIVPSATKATSVAMALEGVTRPRSAMALARPTGASMAMSPRPPRRMPLRLRARRSRLRVRMPLLSLPPLLSLRRSSSPLRSTRLPSPPRRQL